MTFLYYTPIQAVRCGIPTTALGCEGEKGQSRTLQNWNRNLRGCFSLKYQYNILILILLYCTRKELVVGLERLGADKGNRK